MVSIPSDRQKVEKIVREALNDVLGSTDLGLDSYIKSNAQKSQSLINYQAELIFAANWKMNHTIQEAMSFVRDFDPPKDPKKLVIICPPFYHLPVLRKIIAEGSMKLGAQNMFWEDKGAFTGELSPLMLRDTGCEYVILGHSERRHIFGEADDLINRKVQAALSHQLIPILCIGETLDEREAGTTNRVLSNQLRIGLSQLQLTESDRIIIAYEPIWAIGTGKTATPEIAQEAHGFIQDLLREILGPNTSRTRILYGGSVKPENAASLIVQPDIDGFLVGGASLKPGSFQEICKVG